MPTNYVLVDFENVQPDMSALVGTPFKVVVFFGAKQQSSRHHFDKFESLLALGSSLEAVKILHSGRNALDLHIAWWLGRIFERESDATAHVISRDTDFDPLIDFLKSRGLDVTRARDVTGLVRPAPASPPMRKSKASAPTPKRTAPAKTRQPAQPQSPPKPAQDDLALFLKQLRSMTGKPSTRKKLAQTLAAYFKHHGGERPEKDVESQVDELIRRKLVTQTGSRIAYALG
jgi:hypothetical protein